MKNADCVNDYSDYFRNMALRVIIDEYVDSDATVINENDDIFATALSGIATDTNEIPDSTLVSDIYEQTI